MIIFSCSGCHQPLKVKDELAGRKIKCPKCGMILPVVADQGDLRSSPESIRPRGQAPPPEAPARPPRKSRPVEEDEAPRPPRRRQPERDEDDEDPPEDFEDDDYEDRPRRRRGMLDMQQFLIKEQVAFLKTVDVYDIFDPDTQQQVGTAREAISGLVKLLRWFINKNLMSTLVEVRDTPGERLVFSIRRPFRLFRATVEVLDPDKGRLGYFKSKLFSLGGGFWVYDNEDNLFAEVKGDWKGWNFRFMTPEGQELGLVTKKWAGLGKELFTSADNYIVSISDDLADQAVAKTLLLAAALAIDIVYKEQG